MNDVRCLSTPTNQPQPRTQVAPQGQSRQAIAARDTLGQFLDATMVRPLWFNEQEQEHRVQQAMDTMTIDERITIEIEMQSRNATVHSFDYDPLR